jgi:hypothetical protein
VRLQRADKHVCRNPFASRHETRASKKYGRQTAFLDVPQGTHQTVRPCPYPVKAFIYFMGLSFPAASFMITILICILFCSPG